MPSFSLSVAVFPAAVNVTESTLVRGHIDGSESTPVMVRPQADRPVTTKGRQSMSMARRPGRRPRFSD